MTAQQDRAQRIKLNKTIILNAQRDLRQICITLQDRTKHVIDPMILIDYINNDDFLLSPMVMEWGNSPLSALLEDIYEIKAVNGTVIDPNRNDNGRLAMFTDEELAKSISGTTNTVIAGRVRFPF